MTSTLDDAGHAADGDAVQYTCAKIGLVTGRGLAGVLREHHPRALYPAVIALVIANTLVAYSIILATGATLFAAGKTDIASATEAAQALRPLAGDASALLLAVGLIGAGVLAVPVLTGSAAYGVSEAFGWRSGLDRRLTSAPQFYLVIIAATLVGMVIAILEINPITALVLSAVINGLVAAPLLIMVMLVSNNRAAMGERTNGRLLNVVGWITTIVMCSAAGGLIVKTVPGWRTMGMPHDWSGHRSPRPSTGVRSSRSGCGTWRAAGRGDGRAPREVIGRGARTEVFKPQPRPAVLLEERARR